MRPPRPDVAAPEAPPGPGCCVTFSRGVGWATLGPPRPPRPVICGCCCAGAAEVGGVGVCGVLAEAGGPLDGRADGCAAARGVCGAARGAETCGGVCRGAEACEGACRGAEACGGAGRGAAACGGACRGAEACGAGAARGAGAACGAGAGRGAGAACGAEAGGPPRPGGAPPPCFCGCATAVVAIAAEMMKHAAIRVVFHWNMAPPPVSPALLNARAGARVSSARGTRVRHIR